MPTSLALAANRFRMHCLLLAGRADEAVAVADESLAVGGMGNRHAQLMPAVARWQAGDPSGFLGSDRNEAVDEHGEAAAMTAGASREIPSSRQRSAPSSWPASASWTGRR